MEALDQGKSYAERAHAAAAGVGNGVGHGLRCVDCCVHVLGLKMLKCLLQVRRLTENVVVCVVCSDRNGSSLTRKGGCLECEYNIKYKYTCCICVLPLVVIYT